MARKVKAALKLAITDARDGLLSCSVVKVDQSKRSALRGLPDYTSIISPDWLAVHKASGEAVQLRFKRAIGQ